MGSLLDPAFVQALEHQPKPTGSEAAVGIPLIDLSPLLDSPIPAAAGATPPPISALLAEVKAACQQWGFFQVINHGVPSELLDNIMEASKGFFALPAEEKRQVKKDEVNPLGYNDTEHTKNVRDWKEVFDFVVKEPAVFPVLAEPPTNEFLSFMNRWPEYPPGFNDESNLGVSKVRLEEEIELFRQRTLFIEEEVKGSGSITHADIDSGSL